MSSMSVEQAIAELHTYTWTIFEDAANYACSILDPTLVDRDHAINLTGAHDRNNIDYILTSFEVYEYVADRFRNETGYLPYVDYGLEGAKFDLVLGAYLSGYGSVAMSKVVDLNHLSVSIFDACYKEWYHYVADLNIIKPAKMWLKNTLNKNPGASFDYCLDEVVRVLSGSVTLSEVVDESTFRDWLTSKLLATYRRNR